MAKKKRFFKPRSTGSTKYDVIDVYRQSFSTKDLLDIRRKYAKRANQRIRRLEAAARQNKANIGTEPVFTYLRQIGRANKGLGRFSESKDFVRNEDGKIDRWQLKYEISTLAGFLGAERSTIAGRREIAKRTISTMAERYGLKLDEDEAIYLLENFDDFKSMVYMNSDALLQAIGAVAGDITKKEQINKIVDELKGKKTVKTQTDAVYRAMYGRKRKGAAAMKADITAAIIK